MEKKEKNQKILKKIMPKLNLYDTIIMYLFKRYTCKIYRIGLNDEFNWSQKNDYKNRN